MAPKQKASCRLSSAPKRKAKKQSPRKPKAWTENYPPRYPQCIREKQQVNEYFISKIDNPTNFVLGPIYYPHAPAELPTYYPVNFDEPLLLSLPGLHRIGWVTKGTIRSWPSVFEAWEKWVIRMKFFLAPSWRAMNLYEAIDLSTQSLELNPNLIAAAACFWSVSSNAFIFPCGPMTPNVLDIIHLTGLSSLGEDVNATLDHEPYDPPFNLSEGSCGYANFIHKYSVIDAKEPCFHEKIAFYLYWLNKYVMCVSGVKITKEYIRLAVCLAQEIKLALAPFVLGTLYKGLWTFVQNKITSNCGGPFWILQAWLYAYFPTIKPVSNYSKRKDGGQCLSYAEYLLSHEPRQEDVSFRRYFKTFYKPDIGDAPIWLPFKECSYATSEGIKPILQLQDSARIVNQFWATILIPRFISIGFSPTTANFSNCSFEVYCPNQCARQFGLVQGIPVPYTHPRIKDLAKTRPNVTEISVIKELVEYFKKTMASFQFQSFVATPACTTEFNFWWECTQAILFSNDLDNCLFRLDSEITKSASIRKKLLAPQLQGKVKSKKVVSAENLSTLKKRTRSSKDADVIQNPPIMADAMKGYKPAIQQEEMASKEEVEDREIIGFYRTKRKRKLQLPATSDEGNGHDKGLPTKLSSIVDSEPLNLKSNIQLCPKYRVQTSQENKGFEKVEISEHSKPMEMVIVPILYPASQSFTTISNVDDISPSQVRIFAEVLEQLIELNADISMTDMSTANETLVQEEIVQKNEEIQSNSDVQDQYIFMSPKDQEAVQLMFCKSKDNIDMRDKDFSSAALHMIPEILEISQEQDTQLLADVNCNIGRERFLLTEITHVQEQARGTGVFLIGNQELTTDKTPIASRFSVNEVNPELVSTSNSDLDFMLNKAKSYSELFSKSISEFSESLSAPSFYELSEDTKDEVESFFRMLELPLAEIAAHHTPVFTKCVSHLIAKKVLPLSEHIRLEEFWSSLSENLTAAAYCQKEMKEKRDTIDQFSNVSKKLDTMGNSIQHLKVKLQQVDMEEAEVLARLGKLKEERMSLLAQKESINHDLVNIKYDEQEIQTNMSVARASYLKNQERFNVVENKWSYFKRLFMEFKCKIR